MVHVLIFLYVHSWPFCIENPIHCTMLHHKVNSPCFISSLDYLNQWIHHWPSLQRFNITWLPSLFLMRPELFTLLGSYYLYIFEKNFLFVLGLLWPWSYGSWIYNYLCNLCLSPIKLWVWTPFIAKCTPYNIMWKNLSVTCDRSVVFSGFSSFLHQ